MCFLYFYTLLTNSSLFEAIQTSTRSCGIRRFVFVVAWESYLGRKLFWDALLEIPVGVCNSQNETIFLFENGVLIYI